MPTSLLIMIFLTVALLVIGLGFLILGRDPVVAKIGVDPGKERRNANLRLAKQNAKLDHFLKPFAERIRNDNAADENAEDSISLLTSAGFYSPRANAAFLAVRLTLSIILAVGAATILFLSGSTLSPLIATMLVVLLGSIGFYAPLIVVYQMAKENRFQVSRGLPDALDMTLICLEAGQSFPMAIQFVAKEFREAHPAIAKQFEIVTLEFRAGRNRSEALKNMARRVDLPELTSIVNMVNQSEKLGTSLTGAIRAAAFDMRRERMLRAEEKANKLPVLMSVPLTTCIFPTLFMIILVPVILNIIQEIPG